jgi:predicted phosphohydrolase
MFSFQFASDLHIEIYDDDNIDPLEYITPSADILILAGDIGSLYKVAQLYNFIKNLSCYFKYILYVPGNHEYYMLNNYKSISMNTLKNRLNNLSKKINNLIILDKNSVVIDEVCIAGCTLWSNPNCNLPKFIVKIKGINTDIYKKYHQDDLEYINKMIEYCTEKKYKLIMVTHYPPTHKVLTNTKKRKKFLSFYVNNMDTFLKENKVNTWICGHVHANFDFNSENNCRIVSNQKGKPKDKIVNYNKNFTINF